MDVARDLTGWFLAALRLEWTSIAVELACAIQKRFAFVYRAAGSELRSAGAAIDVAYRIISKVAA